MQARYGWVVLVCSMCLGSPAWAAYKCVGTDGRVSYQEIPCAGKLPAPSVPVPAAAIPSASKDVMTPEEIMAAVEAQRERNQASPVRHSPAAVAHDDVLSVGMSSDAVLRAWGKPNAVNQTQTAYGMGEQWVYYRGRYKRQYVYLYNGLVRALQTQD